jgi:hypothetical protein
MLTRLLTILPLLLCPLLMLACMWAMRNREPSQRQARDRHQDLPTAARVSSLRWTSPRSWPERQSSLAVTQPPGR